MHSFLKMGKKGNWHNRKRREQPLSNTFWFYSAHYHQCSKHISSSGKPTTIFIWGTIFSFLHFHLLQGPGFSSTPSWLRITFLRTLRLIKNDQLANLNPWDKHRKILFPFFPLHLNLTESRFSVAGSHFVNSEHFDNMEMSITNNKGRTAWATLFKPLPATGHNWGQWFSWTFHFDALLKSCLA